MNTTIKNRAVLVSLDIAHSSIYRIIKQEADNVRLNLNPMELYIVATLLEKDGIFASRLAAQVGRAATSFTPSLDKLQKLGFIERRADANGDRRAVNIHLTPLARECGGLINEVMNSVNTRIREASGLTEAEWETFNKVVAALQSVE